jgi:hypothetical protein
LEAKDYKLDFAGGDDVCPWDEMGASSASPSKKSITSGSIVLPGAGNNKPLLGRTLTSDIPDKKIGTPLKSVASFDVCPWEEMDSRSPAGVK